MDPEFIKGCIVGLLILAAFALGVYVTHRYYTDS
jgi:hypothetical protein